MRGFLASSIGVTCAAALALPLALPSTAAATAAGPPAAGALPGSTQSLPLAPLGSDRAGGAPRAEGLPRRDVRPFSLLGVVWDDADAELRGTVQVRTRATGTTVWSAWQDVETHNHEHAADPGTAERASGRVRGATAPLWVGDSDGVEVRVRARGAEPATGARAGRPATPRDRAPAADALHAHAAAADAEGRTPAGDAEGRAPADGAPGLLPAGLRLELVDPGAAPPPGGAPADAPRATTMTAEAAASSAVNADLAPLGAPAVPELTKERTRADLLAARGLPGASGARPYVGPRPRIVTRRGWGADERLRERNFAYTKTVKAAFVHHSATGNNYRCSQAPSVLRSIYRYHVESSGWRDIGYNFAVDKCGNIYEGRAGGVAKAVLGAHTLGFNTNSMGIAVLGTYTSAAPPKAAVTAVARLTAWKLGLFGANPRGTTYLKSGGGNLYSKGTKVRLHVISGHRDGFATECPGRRLYSKLGTARTASARYQGR
ncbi:peptidoglycan recognition protein family protein [Streptomyces sp. AN091965]|uniref:peptidoglycan recognition protein family protein n=1 Tax=Streptomyces sp. AN091965 TaxID=2927803 RepID=UPI001F6106C0|nr:peptidoglycan recognition protein [Streptomyces sp. AN091965]MCI3931118.1 peptidoglycan recognition protein [Streptomyces sp. AN091965]